MYQYAADPCNRGPGAAGLPCPKRNDSDPRPERTGEKLFVPRECQNGSLPFREGIPVRLLTALTGRILRKSPSKVPIGGGKGGEKWGFYGKNRKTSLRNGNFKHLARRLRKPSSACPSAAKDGVQNKENNRMSVVESARLIEYREESELWQTVKKSLVSILERPTLW